MSSKPKPSLRWLPVLVIAAVALAFSFSGGNATTCGGACFLPDVAVLVSRH